MKETLGPKDHAEAIALFRAQVLGPLLSRPLSRGDRMSILRELSEQHVRPPDSAVTRKYAVSTLERWLYAYRKHGLAGLAPQLRSDRGAAQALTEAQRKLICDIRRDHSSASAELILRTLVTEGRVKSDAVSANTVRRLLREHALARMSLKHGGSGSRRRRRWQVEHPNLLWHADVCHGPSLRVGKRSVPLRIHGILDDASRYIVAIRALPTEREADMLGLMVDTARRHGVPERLYLDNGSTYVGDTLATMCARLGVKLTHARPYDPQARGKMERFWRTLRQGCLDHMGEQSSHHDVQVRLIAFCDKHYHKAPHSGLLGKTPMQVWEARARRDIDDASLRDALTVRGTRRVRGDGTVSIAGADWELDAGYLAGRKVVIARSLIDVCAAPWVEYDGKRLSLCRVQPVKNSKRPRSTRRGRGIDAVSFDPAGTLVDVLVGRKRKGDA